MRAVVEQVIQTASRVLEGELEGREAVTILATLSRDAVTAGETLSRTDPNRAATYQELLAAIIRELEVRGGRSDDRPSSHDVGMSMGERPAAARHAAEGRGDDGRASERSRYLCAVAEDLAKVQRALAGPGIRPS